MRLLHRRLGPGRVRPVVIEVALRAGRHHETDGCAPEPLGPGRKDLDGPVRHGAGDDGAVGAVAARGDLHATGFHERGLQDARLRAPRVTEIVDVPHAHGTVRGGCQDRVLLVRVPRSARARRAVPLGVLQVADVHVALVELAQLAPVAVVYLRLRVAGDAEELVPRRRPRQRVHRVAVRGHDLAERSQVPLHAVEVVYLDAVVVGAGEEAAPGVFQRHAAHDFLVPLHHGLVGRGEEVIDVVVGSFAVRIVVGFVVVQRGLGSRPPRPRGRRRALRRPLGSLDGPLGSLDGPLGSLHRARRALSRDHPLALLRRALGTGLYAAESPREHCPKRSLLFLLLRRFLQDERLGLAFLPASKVRSLRPLASVPPRVVVVVVEGGRARSGHRLVSLRAI
mmetsp:Transcript_7841/g.32286  ORF Transcript_7841/g.32286 Transcript_7841/m.32286 type:complete len:395 (-) Transcript_7841:123-1307(-)